ncbi:hypothetical protein M9H77_24805 [Catharanthus roseus]|uniref:Uncharacterized protein n=1 Tax=Catharanthus roseus TaxID=4058 RepID=A0ACC0A7S9_CATRO|nr:hypothetical protein M9H77_24805 [Catharanthus roseus]
MAHFSRVRVNYTEKKERKIYNYYLLNCLFGLEANLKVMDSRFNAKSFALKFAFLKDEKKHSIHVEKTVKIERLDLVPSLCPLLKCFKSSHVFEMPPFSLRYNLHDSAPSISTGDFIDLLIL